MAVEIVHVCVVEGSVKYENFAFKQKEITSSNSLALYVIVFG